MPCYLSVLKRPAPPGAAERRCLFAVAAVAAVAASASMGAAPARAVTFELLTNGNFESTTDFAGWTRATDNENPALSTPGNFFIDAPGTTTPVSGNATDANLLTGGGGNKYAVTDGPYVQGGAGGRVLYQAFTVPVSTLTSLTFSFQFFINNFGGADTPTGDGTLNWRQTNTTELVRVDLLRANPSSPFSVTTGTGGDVIRSLFTQPIRNADQANGWEAPASVNLTSFVTPGQTYILRFGEVDNRSPLNFGVDNVSMTFNGTIIAPEPGTFALLVPVLPAAGLILARRRQKKI